MTKVCQTIIIHTNQALECDQKRLGICLCLLHAELYNLLFLAWRLYLHPFPFRSLSEWFYCILTLSTAVLEFSLLGFRSYIYWTQLLTEFHLGNRIYLHHIISNIIYVSFCFGGWLFCWVKIAISSQRKRRLNFRRVRKKRAICILGLCEKSTCSLDSFYTIMGSGK